jgi:hypothetical protein
VAYEGTGRSVEITAGCVWSRCCDEPSEAAACGCREQEQGLSLYKTQVEDHLPVVFVSCQNPRWSLIGTLVIQNGSLKCLCFWERAMARAGQTVAVSCCERKDETCKLRT